MTGAKLLVECLAAHGVDTIFGMPGGHTAAIYDALHGYPGIRHVLVRNEHAGAMMADGYARATGRPGVCLVAAGPGLTNCMTGLGVSYSDSVPILVISGQIRCSAIGSLRGYYHEMDALAITDPLTKWNASARSGRVIPMLVARAFLEMTSGRPRPVHLEFPVDILERETTAVAQMDSPAQTPSVDTRKINEAAEVLNQASRPLIIAGGGVISAAACDELLQVAQLLHSPVLTTPMGKGAFPEDHPLSAGMTFSKITSDLSGMKDNLSPMPNCADAVLAVGCRFSQLATGNWEMRLPPNLIHIDVDIEELGRTYPASIPIHAHARPALQQLSQVLRDRNAESRPRAWSQVFAAASKPTRWRIERMDLAPVLRRTLDRSAIVACDVTRLYYMMLASFPVYQPRTFLHPSCFIAMGYGLPAAIGAKMAFPDRQVVAIAGDGGFMMTAQELACAVQEELNVVAIVINDNCLSGMKGIQNRSYNGRHIAVDLKNPDLVKFAESFGALGLRVTKIDEFEPALQQALQAWKPAVIEVVAPQTAI